MRPIVPEFILQNVLQERQSGHFIAATLFVDFSGFSAMTEALAVHGQHGAEVLASLVRGIFDPLISSVFSQGGFVVGFTGDAFTAVFPVKEEIPSSAMRCLAAAQDMQAQMSALATQVTPYGEFKISIKVGLAWGETIWEIFKSVDGKRATFLFRGAAIDGASLTEHYAQSGQIVLNPDIVNLVKGYIGTEPVRDCFHLVSILQDLPSPQLFGLSPLQTEAVRAFCPAIILSLPITGEFRQVVNVFIDISLPIESAGNLESFMQVVFKLQLRYGGYFLRPDFGDKGSNLLIFWGAPTAHENDIDRALNFLLDLRQETNLPISAGVTYFTAYAGFMGSSLREDYTCYGRGVNLAARFMQEASKGEIWLDQEMARRAERNFELKPVGEIYFKGFKENQKVYALLRRKEKSATIYQSKMVGRNAEMERLIQFVAPLWEGRFPGVMVVKGDAGMGKSRLVHAFQSLPQFAQFRSCWAICQTDEILRQPFNPFRYYLKNYFAILDDMSEEETRLAFTHKLDNLIEKTESMALRTELERTRSVLGALLNLHWPNSLYEQLDAQGRYENTFTALSVLLRAQSLCSPLVLIIEDVHWLDDDSADFLRSFVRVLSSDPGTTYPVALVVTARLEGGAFGLDDPALLSEINLESLSEPDFNLLVEELLGGPASPELLAFLEKRAEGNPFFAEQILRYLQEEQALRKDPEGYRIALDQSGAPIPTDVRAILIARLDRLAQNVREVVQTASVLGREFEVRLLAEMLKGDSIFPDEVEAARQADIWFPLNEIRYIFRHALLRDAAYTMQLQARQRALHELAVSALETLYRDDLASHYGELAYHSEHAGLVEKARIYLELAGGFATQRYENSQALNFYNRALALTPQDDIQKHFDLINARAHIYSILGQRENQNNDLSRLAELAEELADAHRRAIVAICRVRYLHQVGDFPALIDESKQAVALANNSGDVKLMLDVYIAWNQALGRLGRHEEAVLQAQAGLEAARQAGFRFEEGELLNGLGLIAIERRDPAAARDYFEQGLKIAQEIGDRHLEAQTVNNLGNYFAMVMGDYLIGRDYFLQSFHLAEEMGDRMGQGLVVANLGWISGLLGDFNKAAEYHQRALSIAREVGNQYQEAYTLLNLSAAAGYQGNGDMALEYANQGLRQIRLIGDQNGEGWAQLYLGHAYFLESAYQLAREAYRAAIDLRAQLNQPSLELEPLAGLVECALAEKKPQDAMAFCQAILDHFAGGGSVEGAEEPLRVYLACYRGLLENHDGRAHQTLQDGYTLLQENVSRLKDETTRRMYVDNVPWRRAVKEIWEQIQAG